MGDLLGHGGEGGDAHPAGEGHDTLGVPQGLVVELAEAHVAQQMVPHLQLVVHVVGDEAVALRLADGDLHVPVLLPGLVGGGGEGVGPGDDLPVHVELQRDELARVEGGQLLPVGADEADGLRRGAHGIDVLDNQLQLPGMPLPGHVPDGVLLHGDRGGVLKGAQTGLGDPGRAAYILQKSLDFHFAAASFFALMSSSTFLAAFRPLVTAGPMPSPEIWWAPANSSPSMNFSSWAV